MSILKLQTLKPRTADPSAHHNSCTSSYSECCTPLIDE